MRRIAIGWVVLMSCSQAPELTLEPPPPPWEPSTELEVDCAGMCEETIANGCEMTTRLERCVGRCVESVENTGDCVEVTQAYVRCLGEEGLDNCYDVPPGCDDAWLTWSACSATGNGCGPVNCGAPEVGCSCRSLCSGVIVEEACVEDGDAFDCTCSVDGEVVTRCEDSQTTCAFFLGCCASTIAELQQ